MASIRSRASTSGSSQESTQTSESDSTYQTSTSSSRSNKHREEERGYKYAPYYPPSETDLSPSTQVEFRASVDTYASDMSDEEEGEAEEDECCLDGQESECGIPDSLPKYRAAAREPYVRPSNASDFSKLFPSLSRLSIRHDEYTDDGNLNLRVDTSVSTPGHRRIAMQLFHLRMYDLAKREFSLRRYCRDSGREVCNSKRKYREPGTTAEGRPTLQRSVSTYLKNFGSRRGSFNAMSLVKRPGTGFSTREAEDESGRSSRASWYDQGVTRPHHRPARPPHPTATNTIKLEFSNYARVDVVRRGSNGGKGRKSSKRYEFSWWGHKYCWKRHQDKALATISFHLIRDSDNSLPVAHIVPETRTPSQVNAEEIAGGWVPPCHMWINDESILDAVTDVGE